MNFNQIIDKLNQDYEAAVESNKGDAFGKLSIILGELDEYARECIQKLTEKDIKPIIQKLKNGKDLSSDEIEKVRLWIVGDAEQYAKYENNFPDWKEELKRLINEISDLKTEAPELDALLKLRAFFRDGARVVDDIFFYLQQKERVAKFEDSTRELDAEEKEILVRLLEQKLKSKDF